MQKKGQTVSGVGIFITLFITIIVGVILMIAVAQTVGDTLNTGSYNTTAGDAAVTMPANGASIDLEGQEYFNDALVYNASNPFEGNYTITEIVSTSTGVKTVSLNTNAGADAGIAGQSVNISYTFGPDGYVEDSGARGVIRLIVIMFALAIAVIAMEPTLRNGIIYNFGR